jgi:hypothetical protein
MHEKVRLLHSIYATDPDTGNRTLLVREGQTADIDGGCFRFAGEPLEQMLKWRREVRIRIDGSDDWIDVNCWNVEPAA